MYVITSCALRTRAYAGLAQRLEVSSNKGVSNSLTTVAKDYLIMEYEQIGLELGETQEEKGGTELPPNIRIRKLTPKECARLMGFTDRDADAMLSVVSNSQAYKECGNSIVVAVLEAIMGQFFEGKEHHWERWLSERAYESRDNQASD